MERDKFLHPSQSYEKSWVIEQLLNNKSKSMQYATRGVNILDKMGYMPYYHIALPYDCLLVWEEPIEGYTPNGAMFDSCECEVYLYYIE